MPAKKARTREKKLSTRKNRAREKKVKHEFYMALIGLRTPWLTYQLNSSTKVVIQPDIYTDALPHIAEHKHSAISKHLLDVHGDKNLINEDQCCFLKKYHGKFDCLVYDMLFIKELRPSLNTQSDSIRPKLFV